MNFRAGGLIIIPLVIQIVVSLFCGHFNIGTSGGITNLATVPSSGWDIITSGIGWFGSALTFQLTGGLLILSIFLWLLVVCEVLGIIMIVRGTN